mgnify:FL=1
MPVLCVSVIYDESYFLKTSVINYVLIVSKNFAQF